MPLSLLYHGRVLLALVMAMGMVKGHFLERSVTVDGIARAYRVWVPADYDHVRRWPAMLFLHGSGERGSDGVKPTEVGLGPALADGTAAVEAIVVFPQCPEAEHWVGPARAIAMAALDAVEKEWSIDRNRVSLTGISMGGAGAWVLAAEHPKRWSAVAPVCGWVVRPPNLTSIPDNHLPWLGEGDARPAAIAERLQSLPVWILHGAADQTVPVAESRRMASLLGANAAYTEFPGVGHNAWDPAYRTTGVAAWLVRQKRR